MIDAITIIESVYYLLKKLGRADKLKIVKLLYLADKYHLLKYGRTITNDDYYALPLGPVGSTLKDILDSDNNFFLAKPVKEYFAELIQREGDYEYTPKKSQLEIEFDALSESDKEALDFIIEKFGNLTSFQLVEFTHTFPEWNQYKELFDNNATKSERISIEDLLSIDSKGIFDFDEEHIEESRNVLKEAYD